MEPYISVDGLRATLVLVLSIGQAVMGYWPEFRKWPETISSRSARLRSPLIPIDWAFAIWGLIFAACIAYGVWQFLPSNLEHPLLRRIGWLAVALFALNVLWELHVPRNTLDRLSVAILVTELAFVLAILFIVTGERSTLSRPDFWLVSAPFQLFAGWISAAVFANTASALQNEGRRIGSRLSAAMIVGATALGAIVAALTEGWIYAAALAWALFGLAVANAVRERNTSIAVLCALMIPVVAAAAAAGR